MKELQQRMDKSAFISSFVMAPVVLASVGMLLAALLDYFWADAPFGKGYTLFMIFSPLILYYCCIPGVALNGICANLFIQHVRWGQLSGAGRTFVLMHADQHPLRYNFLGVTVTGGRLKTAAIGYIGTNLALVWNKLQPWASELAQRRSALFHPAVVTALLNVTNATNATLANATSATLVHAATTLLRGG